MTSVILVPVKEHSMAKSRMSPLLTPLERAAVSWAMLEDLIRALRPLPYPVATVTNSARAAARAESLGWRVVWEDVQVSESASVDAASRQLAQEGAEAVLRLPADVPLVQSWDVEEILTLPITAPGAVMVPARDRKGTNALLRTPPGLFPSRFGHDSFARHKSEAEQVQADLRILENARLALDLDDAGDIEHFLSLQEEGETFRALMDFQVRERLVRHAGQ
jgi:2-phospho-L-lactate guanylyltransferase